MKSETKKAAFLYQEAREYSGHRRVRGLKKRARRIDRRARRQGWKVAILWNVLGLLVALAFAGCYGSHDPQSSEPYDSEEEAPECQAEPREGCLYGTLCWCWVDEDDGDTRCWTCREECELDNSSSEMCTYAGERAANYERCLSDVCVGAPWTLDD